jgi:hypothetical protein
MKLSKSHIKTYLELPYNASIPDLCYTALELYDENDRLRSELADLNEKINQIRQACADTDPFSALDRIEEILEGK